MKKVSLWLLNFFSITSSVVAVKFLDHYRIGGLFSDDIHKAAFQVVIDNLNKKWDTAPFFLIGDSLNVSFTNHFHVQKAACSLLDKRVIGIFGPSSRHTSSYIQSICDNKEIPQIETHYNPNVEKIQSDINLYPHAAEIAYFVMHLIREFTWDTIIILYENNDSLERIAPLLELNIEYGVQLVFRQLEVDQDGSYRAALKIIKKMSVTNILIECSLDILEEVLIESQKVGLITEKYRFIITNLDLSTLDLERFQYSGCNITGIRMFSTENENLIALAEKIKTTPHLIEEELELKRIMTLSTVLLIDGLNMFYDVIKELSEMSKIKAEKLKCHDAISWKYGSTIVNQLKSKVYQGITGRVSFDLAGFRRYFTLDLLELTTKGLLKVGQWDSEEKSLITDRSQVPQEESDVEHSIFNRTFRVLIVLTAPYAMLKESTDQLIGNDQFEGFCIDIIHELSVILGFNYTFIVQEDGKNGNLDRATNEWDGVIRQIIDGNADLGITDLTVTSDRERVVDFSLQFMNLGISILYRKPEPVPPSLFMFLSPFSTRVWLMLGVAYIFVSISIFIMGRLSPSEWTNPYPCVDEPEYLVNQFSIRNSLWFTIGGLLQQGSELAPIGISIRTASGFWWFFILIMVSSYTANLAAFLTVETRVTPFKNIDDLAKQTEIKYGAKRGGATASFFHDSNLTTNQIVYKHLKEHDDQMTDENEEGVRRVETENYAFLMESVTIEYNVARHCSLAQVGGLLDNKGYGIAMQKDSKYRNEISTAVVKLQETGVLTKLKIKWWKEQRGGSTCSIQSKKSEAEALDLQNVGGVFLVLFLGALLALLGSFIEMCVILYRKRKVYKKPFKYLLWKELEFFFQFGKNVKTVGRDEREPVSNQNNKVSF
ncbi:glutamate receptor ionotropic, kainate 2-like [Anthonomus grandis grandis]|uniref:glutamate receptor ionotropic, kainate 2-like n=1 Tax=Anthonomus grandis grandis TaxID=2921223 RepID=UPI0021663653|nr:glutamate receptor ionotropic, kainate 2-like [Anthonomus grandis grandis]